MHRCLGMTEIIHCIAETIWLEKRTDDDWELPDALRSGPDEDLYVLARTCRAFLEPALDALWRTQFHLGNLVKCMPEDLWDLDDSQERRPFFVRTPLPTEWERFDYYARKVKAIVIGSEFDHEDLIADVCARGKNPLFPKLCAVNMWLVSDTFSYLPFFLTRRVRQVRIYVKCEWSGRGLNRFLDFLQEWTSRVESVRLEYEEDVDVPYAPLSDFATPLECLNTFEWDIPLPWTDVWELAKLPNLHTLKLTVKDPAVNLHGSPLLPFPALLDLDLTMETMEGCLNFLDALRHRPLHSLVIEGDRTALDDIPSLIQYLSQPRLTESLKIIVINGTLDALWVPIPFERFRPLLLLKHLEDFSFRLQCKFIAGDKELIEMAQAWPHLRCLILGYSPMYHEPGFTLNGLAQLVRLCPCLNDISIPINADISEYEPLPVAERELYNGKVTMLAFGRSKVGDPVSVAMFLSRLFPNVKLVTGHDEAGGSAAWDKVRDYAKAFASVRREERLLWRTPA